MLSPLPASAWNRDAAAHLAQRAGFGAGRAELERLTGLGPEGAVEAFLNAAPTDDAPPPAWTQAAPPPASAMAMAGDPAAKQAMQQARRREMAIELRELTHWWLERMANGSEPLREKLCLFWHGHFATGNEKVNSALLMWRQNETFRRMGTGDARALTKAVSRDPAMIVWLDLRGSRRGSPNENFARELLELFTLGEGNYTEEDVKEAARAFTGRRIDRATTLFRFDAGTYDPGEKRLFGAVGPWDGDAAIDLVFAQPACARFLTGKLWRFFVTDEPPSFELAEALAAELRRRHYVVSEFLRTVFLSREFYAGHIRRAQIKSPVQLIVQGSRTLQGTLPDPETLAGTLRRLGQEPFYPPNVKGWDGGKAWINTATLDARYALARRLVFGRPAKSPPTAPSALRPVIAAGPPPVPPIPPLSIVGLITDDERTDPARLVRALGSVAFQGEPPPALLADFLSVIANRPKPIDDAAARELLAVMLETPNYQLC